MYHFLCLYGHLVITTATHLLDKPGPHVLTAIVYPYTSGLYSQKLFLAATPGDATASMYTHAKLIYTTDCESYVYNTSTSGKSDGGEWRTAGEM